MLEVELDCLGAWASEIVIPNPILVECGSLAGRSTMAIIQNVSSTTAELYCYDRWPSHVLWPITNDFRILYGQDHGVPWDCTGQLRVGDAVDFFELFQRYHQSDPRVRACQCSLPKAPYLPTKIDFFFFDLVHHNPLDRTVLELFLPYFHDQTIICGHDFIDCFPDVEENCMWLCQQLNRKLERGVGSLWRLG